MALGITTAGGGGNFEIIPLVKYDARSGRIFRVDREQNSSGQYTNEQIEITQAFKACVDLENIEVGPMHFAAGVAPVMLLVPLGQTKPAKPGKEFKDGVRVMLKLGNECGGDVRELAGNSNSFINGFDALHDAYIEGVKANPGKLPIIKLATAEAVKSGSGARTSTNYQPHFEITGWAPRPADLVFIPKAGAASPSIAPSVQQQHAPSTGSTPVGPPPRKTEVPAAALNDFG